MKPVITIRQTLYFSQLNFCDHSSPDSVKHVEKKKSPPQIKLMPQPNKKEDSKLKLAVKYIIAVTCFTIPVLVYWFVLPILIKFFESISGS